MSGSAGCRCFYFLGQQNNIDFIQTRAGEDCPQLPWLRYSLPSSLYCVNLIADELRNLTQL